MRNLRQGMVGLLMAFWIAPVSAQPTASQQQTPQQQTPPQQASQPAPGLTAEQQELRKLRGYVAEVSERMQALSQQLRMSEQRNQLQSQLIDSLELSLKVQKLQRRVREGFFNGLRERLGLSPVYQIGTDRAIVYVDPIFIFRTAEIGSEGRDRVADLVAAMQLELDRLPAEMHWAVQVQGHSDSRPPRSDALFDTNWELSAARAVAFLQLLRAQGLPDAQLYASGFAATRLAAQGDTNEAHRQNRRIELHLQLLPK